MARYLSLLIISLLAIGTFSQSAWAQLPPGAKPNITAPTGGGKQFWTDQFVHHGWRIQRNIYTGHCRLLDNKDFRRAWGTYQGCQREFRRLSRQLRSKKLLRLKKVLWNQGKHRKVRLPRIKR